MTVAKLTSKKKATDEVTKGATQVAAAGASAPAPAPAPARLRKAKAWQDWTVADIMKQIKNIPEDTDKAALKAYVEESIDVLKSMAPKAIGVPPADYIVQSIENYVNDGGLDASEEDESDVLLGLGGEDGEDGDQPIIEVSQEQLKNALKALLMTSNSMLALFYGKHDEYNKEFFDGKLSTPVLTIEKLNNRTLGNYTEGKDKMALDHHIRFNQNFVALNTEERVLETLRHEMIHQWQDEVLYVVQGANKSVPIKLPSMGPDGNIVMVDAVQKKRPKEWHNADFKAMAAWVGIPAIGSKCYGNPAKMPEAKSYNRKFQCLCVASNNYPMTIYSTRAVDATCNACETKFVEVEKTLFKGKVIEVAVSHIEKPGQDAVMETMKQDFNHFQRYEKKGEKDDFVERLKAGEVEEQAVTDMKEGVYQKNHNAYGLGYRYWVAYNTEHSEDKLSPDELRKAVDMVAKGKKPKGTKPTPAAPTAQPVAGNQLPGKGKILKFSKKVTDASDEIGATKEVERVYSAENPQDIIDLYRELGTTRKVAEKLGMAQSTLSGKAKKMSIDWNAGTFNPDWNK